MSKLVKEYPITIGYRDSALGARKLNELSERTGRSRAEVLRLLVAIAEPTDLPAARVVAPTAGTSADETPPAA
jgi:hypothetical protein